MPGPTLAQPLPSVCESTPDGVFDPLQCAQSIAAMDQPPGADAFSRLPDRVRITPDPIYVPLATVGQTSAAVPVQVQNTQDSAIVVSGLRGSSDSPFELENPAEWLLLPGDAVELSIAFRPTATGVAYDSLWLFDGQDQPLAVLQAVGLGLPAPSFYDSPTKHDALDLVTAWSDLNDNTIDTIADYLHSNLRRYLLMTESNPTIPRSLLGGGSVLHRAISEAFGNLALGEGVGVAGAAPATSSMPSQPSSSSSEHFLWSLDQNLGSNLAYEVSAKVAKATWTASSAASIGGDLAELDVIVAGTEAGATFGPAGAAIGFVVSALISTIIGVIVDAVSGSDVAAFSRTPTNGESSTPRSAVTRSSPQQSP